MKLQLRYWQGPIRPYYVVTNEAGEMLPCQQDVTIEQSISGRTHVVVRFVVDEDHFCLTSEPAKATKS